MGSGIIASIFLYIGRFVLGNLISKISLSRTITGTWKTTFFKNGSEFNEMAYISQLFSIVWGKIEYYKQGHKRIYKMRGSIKEGILVANYEIIRSKSTLDRGSFTLHLSNDGNTLEGCYSWTDDDSPIPQGAKYVWNKQHE